MLKAKAVGKVIRFTPTSQLELREEERFVVDIRLLKRSKTVELQEEHFQIDTESGKVVGSAKYQSALVASSIQSWSNLVDEEGHQIVFDPSNAEELLEFLPNDVYNELSLFISK